LRDLLIQFCYCRRWYSQRIEQFNTIDAVTPKNEEHKTTNQIVQEQRTPQIDESTTKE
jgi:hypothetical protein